MAIHYVPEVYQRLVDQKVGYLLSEIKEKGPICGERLQEDLVRIILKKAETLESDAEYMSQEEFDQVWENLWSALLVTKELTNPSPGKLVPILEKLVKGDVKPEEVAEKARSLGIGVNDKNPIYIA